VRLVDTMARPRWTWRRALGALALAVVLAVAEAAIGSEPVEVERVDAAILRLLQRGLPAHDIGPWPRHPVALDATQRRELAEAVVEAGTAHGVDPYLLTAIAFREGSFLRSGIGNLGEVSTFQMVPPTARYASRLDARCSTEDGYHGSARCAAALLAHWREHRCGSLEGALSYYASGRTCRPDTDRLRWIVRDRFGIAQRLARR